jgi:AraC-like DNA-binding protein
MLEHADLARRDTVIRGHFPYTEWCGATEFDDTLAFGRWESPHLPGLTFCETAVHGVSYANHLHDALEIMWLRSGDAEIICHGRRYPMRTGDAVVIAPNEVHAGGACRGSRFSFAALHVPRALVDALVGRGWLNGRAGAPVRLIEGAFAEALYRDLIHGLPETVSASDQLCLLGEVLGRFCKARPPIARPAAGPDVLHPAVDRVKSIINAKFTESIDLGQLAREVDLHERYLISLFKATTGIPPHQYQIAMRVDFARRLIEHHLPLSTVAVTAGFADQSHLNRHFKRTYGVTPGVFRGHAFAG